MRERLRETDRASGPIIPILIPIIITITITTSILSKAIYSNPRYVVEIRVYMLHLLKALEHSHQNGIIHQDIKPSNYLFDTKRSEGNLIDFGILQDAKAGKTAFTESDDEIITNCQTQRYSQAGEDEESATNPTAADTTERAKAKLSNRDARFPGPRDRLPEL